MKSIRVDIAGGAQRIWIAADAEGISVWNGAFWQQRLTRDEALRLAEAIEWQASQAFPPTEADR